MDTQQQLLKNQRKARANAAVYKTLAKTASSKAMKKALKQLAKDDRVNAKIYKGLAGKKAKPGFLTLKLQKTLLTSISEGDLYYITLVRRLLSGLRARRVNQKASAGALDTKKLVRLSTSMSGAKQHTKNLKQALRA